VRTSQDGQNGTFLHKTVINLSQTKAKPLLNRETWYSPLGQEEAGQDLEDPSWCRTVRKVDTLGYSPIEEHLLD